MRDHQASIEWRACVLGKTHPQFRSFARILNAKSVPQYDRAQIIRRRAKQRGRFQHIAIAVLERKFNGAALDVGQVPFQRLRESLALDSVGDFLLDHRDVIGLALLVTMLFFSSLAFTVLENAMSVIFVHRVAIRRRHFLVSALIPYCYIVCLGLGLLLVTLVATSLQTGSGADDGKGGSTDGATRDFTI